MKDISKRPDGGVIEQLNLTPEQWVGLLDKEGPWLPYCCGSISTARDVLADCLRQSGRFDKRDAVTIICEIADHDGADGGLHAILDGCGAWVEGGTPEFTGRRLFWSREGSPWFEIARACKAVLGEGNVVKKARRIKRQEKAASLARLKVLAEKLGKSPEVA